MGARLTESQLRAKVQAIASGVTYLSGYTALNKRAQFRCYCGNIWVAFVSNVLKGLGCGCTRGAKKLTHAEYVAKLASRNSELHVVGKYAGSKVSIKHKHLICGKLVFLAPTDALAGKTCVHCYGHPLKTHARYVKEIRVAYPDIDVLSNYVDAKTKIQLRHSCGYTWYARPGRETCPRCSKKRKYVNNGDNPRLLRGREPLALKWLLKHTSLDDAEILSSQAELPKFTYFLSSCRRKYIPDFFIPSRNIVVEVKSLDSAGLTDHYFYRKGSDVFKEMTAKASAVVADGYRFVLMVVASDGRRISLPKDWMTQRRNQLVKHITK